MTSLRRAVKSLRIRAGDIIVVPSQEMAERVMHLDLPEELGGTPILVVKPGEKIWTMPKERLNSMGWFRREAKDGEG